MVSSRATAESEHALSALRIVHTMDADARRDVHVVHILRRDEDVLLPVGCVSSLDLGQWSSAYQKLWDLAEDLPSSSY